MTFTFINKYTETARSILGTYTLPSIDLSVGLVYTDNTQNLHATLDSRVALEIIIFNPKDRTCREVKTINDFAFRKLFPFSKKGTKWYDIPMTKDNKQKIKYTDVDTINAKIEFFNENLF